MDSFELNKMAGAFLATVFVLFSLTILSEAIFHHEVPETPGYVIEAAESTGGEAGAGAAADARPLGARPGPPEPACLGAAGMLPVRDTGTDPCPTPKAA